ncbi:MAG: hypothetical protein UV65_C0034G0019 [Parcubacteria group bacterium GW2011_GWF2_43_11]|nr:MAG: hypothetical protein UV65_C0034G0019 [Parcubacteria group bacterium GW2011_GWF2_43_11]
MVRVKKDGVGINNGIAVRVAFIINEAIEVALIINTNGKITEPPHSRSRIDGQHGCPSDDICIPPADYRQMFFMAGGILGKPRREKVPTR